MSLTIRDDSDSSDPSAVQDVVLGLTLQQYCQVATIALLVYEALITMEKEIEFFWRDFRKPVTIIYFMNRYLGILAAVSVLFSIRTNVSLGTCKYALWSYNIIGWLTIVLIDYILLIRVLALYQKDRTLSICLTILLGLCAAGRLSLVTYLTWAQNLIIVPITDDITACSAGTTPPQILVYIDWIIPMAYGLLLMVFALHGAREFWTASAGFKGFQLVKILVLDQAVYFSIAVACCVFNIMEIKLINNLILSIFLNQAGSVSFLSILGTRMLIKLKEAGRRGSNEGTSYAPKSISGVEFVQGHKSEGSSGTV